MHDDHSGQQSGRPLKRRGFDAIVRSGLPRAIHRALLRKRLTILMYHGLAPAAAPAAIDDWCFVPVPSFRTQMEYLRRHFTVLPLGEAVARLRRGRIGGPTAVITFDDGFHSVFRDAFPILRELALPAAVFVVTGLVDTDDTVWFCRLDRALAATRLRRLEWRRRVFDVASPSGKLAAAVALQDRLRALPNPDLVREVDDLTAVLAGGAGDPGRRLAADSPFRMLSSAAMREMAASGLIEIGAHTHSHAVLSRLTAPERRREIETSIAAVATLTGRPCTLFAYPNGRAIDYNADAVSLLRQCGIEAAVTAITGSNHRRTSPLELLRVSVASHLRPTQFALRVHHWSGKLGG